MKEANKVSSPQLVESDCESLNGTRTDKKQSAAKVSLLSDKKVFEYAEKSAMDSVRVSQSGLGGSTSMMLRKQTSMMTPYMHKVLLNLRITLGVPAGAIKESDLKCSLMSSLAAS
jgi:hypothetical protein